MSLKDVITTLTGEPADAESARRPMLEEIARMRRAFDGGRGMDDPNGWFSPSDGSRVAFTPKRPDGQPIVIGGQAVTFWEEGDVAAMLDAFEQAVREGEADGELTGATPAGSSLPLDTLTSRMRARD